jgi:hypothetical protein
MFRRLTEREFRLCTASLLLPTMASVNAAWALIDLNAADFAVVLIVGHKHHRAPFGAYHTLTYPCLLVISLSVAPTAPNPREHALALLEIRSLPSLPLPESTR